MTLLVIIPTMEPVHDGFKLCTYCWVMLPIGCFGAHRDAPDGKRSWCKQCKSFKAMSSPTYHQSMQRHMHSRRAGAGPMPPVWKWEAVKAEWDGCYSCGRSDCRMTYGHIQPISRDGTNDIRNMAPQCWPCNQAQGSKLVEEWCPDEAERIHCTQADIVNSLSTAVR